MVAAKRKAQKLLNMAMVLMVNMILVSKGPVVQGKGVENLTAKDIAEK